MKMNGITEYCEGMEVELIQTEGCSSYINQERGRGKGRWVVQAFNEAGQNRTEVDVLELVSWLKANRADLLE